MLRIAIHLLFGHMYLNIGLVVANQVLQCQYPVEIRGTEHRRVSLMNGLYVSHTLLYIMVEEAIRPSTWLYF